MPVPPRPVCRLFALAALSALSTTPVFGAAQIYYDGTGSGTSVTNLGTLGAAGNGLIQTGGTGSGSFLTTGGALGAADGFLSLNNSASNGARVIVPAALLGNFNNTSWSISGSFNRTALGNDLDTVFHFSNGDTAGGENELYLLGNSNTNNNFNLVHYYGNGLTDVNTSSVSLATGVWHNYAVTFLSSGLNDGKGTISLYLNGTLRATDSDITGGFAMQQLLQLGGTAAGTTTVNAARDFFGGIDEFAFYDQVLTSTEVTGLHTRTITPLSIPEPTSAGLLLLGSLSLLGSRRRRA